MAKLTQRMYKTGEYLIYRVIRLFIIHGARIHLTARNNINTVKVPYYSIGSDRRSATYSRISFRANHKLPVER